MSLLNESVIFIVDSSQALSGNASSFTYQMNIPKGVGFDRVVVLQAILPKSFYLVNSPNNTFTLQENGVNVTITIPEGNYNVKSFQTILTYLWDHPMLGHMQCHFQMQFHNLILDCTRIQFPVIRLNLLLLCLFLVFMNKWD